MSNSNNDRENDKPGGCLELDLLRQVATGTASATEEALVENHLNDCSRCAKRLERLLESTEGLDELRMAKGERSDADMEAIRAAGFPRFPEAEVSHGQVVLSNGLRLGLPRDSRYMARMGAYDVLSVIGEGGMGVVLRAWEESLQREVAIKVMSPRWQNDPIARERFLKEARSAAGLKHPNVATIHAIDQDAGLPFLVMEYIQGKSLALLIAEEGCLEPARAVGIIRQVLAALEHAHRQGIVHRDVKPANILLEEGTGLIKLVDFGLARGVADALRNTAEGSVLGTPWYMSPEHASGAVGADPRSDLFSVGVVLFEMLAGALPFLGHDVRDVLKQIRLGETPDLCRLNPGVPQRLAEVVCRAMEKDRSRRYASAGEFAKALDEFLAIGDARMAAVPGSAPAKVRAAVTDAMLGVLGDYGVER